MRGVSGEREATRDADALLSAHARSVVASATSSPVCRLPAACVRMCGCRSLRIMDPRDEAAAAACLSPEPPGAITRHKSSLGCLRHQATTASSSRVSLPVVHGPFFCGWTVGPPHYCLPVRSPARGRCRRGQAPRQQPHAAACLPWDSRCSAPTAARSSGRARCRWQRARPSWACSRSWSGCRSCAALPGTGWRHGAWLGCWLQPCRQRLRARAAPDSRPAASQMTRRRQKQQRPC